MVMMAPVVAAAIEARRDAAGPAAGLDRPDGARGRAARPGARGRPGAATPRLLLVCGRYEGIDERVRELGLFDEEISLGDFVLPGGEAAALALTEAVSRLDSGRRRRRRVARERVVPRASASTIRTTRGRASSGASRFRRSSSPATTRGSSAGGGPRALARTRERRPDLLERRPAEPGEDGE